ncbi:MAG TPA: phosphoribosylglycinamide formyltransferase [Bacillota bacterium]|nr:phosphoribosylglycinamide formyltransferase [Bacillota bacterium]
MKRIGVLVSGGGTNLQAIVDGVKKGEIPAEVGVVISNKPGVYALERAAQNQIPTRVIDHREYPSVPDFTQAILNCLREFQIDLVCLAGFLRIFDGLLVEAYPNRILNIHPALLPAFGGKGMYGHHVHEAVIASGAKYSGATVHLVTAETDVGPIVAQGIIAVSDQDTPETLAAKVLQIEHQIYPQAIRMLALDKLIVEGLRVKEKL